MLVLSRQRDQSIMIGDDIEVTIVDVRGDKVRLGISAPRDVSVHRKEVYEAIKRENAAAATLRPEDLSARSGGDAAEQEPRALEESLAIVRAVRAGAVPFVERGDGYAVSALSVKDVPTLICLGIDPVEAAEDGELPALRDEFERLAAEACRGGVKRCGPTTFIYRPPNGDGGRWVFEGGFPVREVGSLPAGPLGIRQWPAGRCASVIVVGHAGVVERGWDSLRRQAQAKGLRLAGPRRELHHAASAGGIVVELQADLEG